MKKAMSSLCAAALLAIAAPVSAGVVIGSYAFADNAFADTVSSSGDLTPFGGTLPGVLTDKSVDTGAFNGPSGSFAILGFTDNTVFNGSTLADLVIFEEGDPSTLRVTINNITFDYTPVSIGLLNSSGFNVNAAEIDLGVFGIVSGGTISSLRINMGLRTSDVAPSLLEVGALSSRDVVPVPEPASLALVGLAMVGLTVTTRLRRR